VHIVIRFPVQQPRDFVSGCESLEVMEFVLEDALVQVPAESDVQRSGQTAMM